ncbi:MAG: hypothetical protein Kow0056_15330 [Coriobacteriia bacterium]
MPLVEDIIERIELAAQEYYRLILIVGPAGSGKTCALREVSVSLSAPLINLNLELSRRMLDLTERQRALQLPRLLGEIVGEATGELVLLDNIEILFDVHLKRILCVCFRDCPGTRRSWPPGTDASWMVT